MELQTHTYSSISWFHTCHRSVETEIGALQENCLKRTGKSGKHAVKQTIISEVRFKSAIVFQRDD